MQGQVISLPFSCPTVNKSNLDHFPKEYSGGSFAAFARGMEEFSAPSLSLPAIIRES